jgi:hypothetical protein
MLACAGLALSPAVANAAAKKKPAKPAAKTQKTSAAGLGDRTALSSTLQLAAMNTAIKAAPSYFTGRTTGCSNVTAMLAAQPGAIIAGNFRDAEGNCYVWLNLDQSSLLTGSEICKTTLHEVGHLSGLRHSGDSHDVMFAPFISDSMPAPCVAKPAAAKVKASRSVCPPGANGADYCQALPAKKAAKRSRARKAA